MHIHDVFGKKLPFELVAQAFAHILFSSHYCGGGGVELNGSGTASDAVHGGHGIVDAVQLVVAFGKAKQGLAEAHQGNVDVVASQMVGMLKAGGHEFADEIVELVGGVDAQVERFLRMVAEGEAAGEISCHTGRTAQEGGIRCDYRQSQTRVAVFVGFQYALLVAFGQIEAHVGSGFGLEGFFGLGHVVAQKEYAACFRCHLLIAGNHVVPVKGSAVGIFVAVDKPGIGHIVAPTPSGGLAGAVASLAAVAPPVVDKVTHHRENHLVAILVFCQKEVFIGGVALFIELISAFLHVFEIVGSLLPFLKPHVAFSAEHVCRALGGTSVIG